MNIEQPSEVYLSIYLSTWYKLLVQCPTALMGREMVSVCYLTIYLSIYLTIYLSLSTWYKLLVQCPTALMCREMVSVCSGAEEIVKGCHSKYAMLGMFRNTQSPGLKLKLGGRFITRFTTQIDRQLVRQIDRQLIRKILNQIDS